MRNTQKISVMKMNTFGNQLQDVIYSTPSGLWVIWNNGGYAYKLQDYIIATVDISVDRHVEMLHFLDGSSSIDVPGHQEISMNLSLIVGNMESKEVKRFSDIFTVEDLKKLSKVTTQKFNKMVK